MTASSGVGSQSRSSAPGYPPDDSRQAATLHILAAARGLARAGPEGQGRTRAAALRQALHVQHHDCRQRGRACGPAERRSDDTFGRIHRGKASSPATMRGRAAIISKKASSATLARLYERADTPRLSGVQIKAPMYLDVKGALSAATGEAVHPHSQTCGHRLAMTLCRLSNGSPWRSVVPRALKAPVTALVAMPDGMPPALLVERCDIRRRHR